MRYWNNPKAKFPFNNRGWVWPLVFQTVASVAPSLLSSVGGGGAKQVDYAANQSNFLAGLDGEVNDVVNNVNSKFGNTAFNTQAWKDFETIAGNYKNTMLAIPLGDEKYDYMQAQPRSDWNSAKNSVSIAIEKELSGTTPLTPAETITFQDLWTKLTSAQPATAATAATTGQPAAAQGTNWTYILIGAGLLLVAGLFIAKRR